MMSFLNKIRYYLIRKKINFRLREMYGLTCKYDGNFKMLLLLSFVNDIKFKFFVFKMRQHRKSYWYLPI